VDRGDVRSVQLDVYDSKGGLWNPDLGELAAPDGWEFLPSGDTFVTRRVKAAGLYWNVWRPRGRNRPHRSRLGVFAPAATIAAARDAAEKTEQRRVRQRTSNARHRGKVEAAYRDEFSASVRAWLAFAPEHAHLAEEIVRDTADRAVVVGSGRVGRTTLLPLEQRAALAARATIRHRFTDYEDRLDELDRFGSEVDGSEIDGSEIDDFHYRATKQAAMAAVDEFLDAHRRPPESA
jgi:hypothetical protein